MAHTSGVLASPPSTTLARKDVGRNPHCRWRRPQSIEIGDRRAGPARYVEKNNTTRQETGKSHQRAVGPQPLFADGLPCVLLRFMARVLREASGECGVAQQTDDICGESFF